VGDQARCECDAGYGDDAGECVAPCGPDPALCGVAARSFGVLVSGNGHGVLGYDVQSRKADTLLEHPYRNWDEGVWTRDLLYDSYLGLRTPDGGGRWLNEVELQSVGYLRESGVLRQVQRVGDLEVSTYFWAPWELARPGLVMVGRVRNLGAVQQRASLYSLHNYHLGTTSDAQPTQPNATGEQIRFEQELGAYLEQGPGGTLLHLPLGPTTHHGCSPDNPWGALRAGQDLSDRADSGVGDDRVAGFQRDFDLAPGGEGWFGVLTAFEPGADLDGLRSAATGAYPGLDAQGALDAALAAWEAWRRPAPAGLHPAELSVLRQSEAILRQGQVWEPHDRSQGQILASMPPGNWNICWMRDMAYAIVALARLGHQREAEAALRFVLEADSGLYQDPYVGLPYQVTITRYFGRGREETDFNEHGPNIEFDGFGLFLWALAATAEASGDLSLVEEHWATVRDRVAGALLGLRDPETGLIRADSSIWEVHWDGQQKRYSYTALTAAAGLCAAAGLAEALEEPDLASEWRAAGRALRAAVTQHLVDGGGALASSYEELRAGQGYRDMASVEAWSMGLFDPLGAMATATFRMFDEHQRVASGRGYYRNDDGGWYDSQEWVFVDLRTSLGLRRAGRDQEADALLDWITAQAWANWGMIAELQHPETSAYEGEVPMVGFGAGAWILALLERGAGAAAPACGGWDP